MRELATLALIRLINVNPPDVTIHRWAIGYDKYLPGNSLRYIIRLIITISETRGKYYLFYQILIKKENSNKNTIKMTVLLEIKGFLEFAGEYLLIL
jgi:hypothetical protein